MRYNIFDFNSEDKGRVTGDFAHSALTVSIVWWTGENSFGTLGKTDKTFIPALDHLTGANFELEWLASLVALVKFFAVW